MKKIYFFLITLIIANLVYGCNLKSAKSPSVKERLKERVENIVSYKQSGVMELKVGKEKLVYNIDIWYGKPEQYRVSFQNENVERDQIILKNKKGVHVLTPALNKSVQFQSEWPNNGGQIYLYKSLITDILTDKKAKLTKKNNKYIFSTKTRYVPNKSLKTQDIILNPKTLEIEEVNVFDDANNIAVTMNFKKMNKTPHFSKADFELEKNMTLVSMMKPETVETTSTFFYNRYPGITIDDIILRSEKKFTTEYGDYSQLVFKGNERGFTLIEKKAKADKILINTYKIGEPIDMGFTIGSKTNNSLTWVEGGIEFLLLSKELSLDEMVSIANSLHTIK